MKEDEKTCQAFGQKLRLTYLKKEDPNSSSRTNRTNTGGGAGVVHKKKKPFCLHPPHCKKDIKHFLKHCKPCLVGENENLMREYLEKLKKANGKAHRLRKKAFASTSTPTDQPESTIISTAVFGS